MSNQTAKTVANSAARASDAPAHHRSAPRSVLLAFALAVLVAFFGLIGTNFFTTQNALEIGRLSVELGLLALALTPVIMTGGIDLSVGSLMALSAVVMGLLWRDAGCPLWLAACAGIATGTLGGFLNATLITRVKIPPLIVTLGTLWLFRGSAEAITRGVDTVSGFPEWFLSIGQGYLGGVLPTQLPILIVAAIFFWLLVHRAIAGRTWTMLGFSESATRHACVNVERSLTLAYTLSGLAAGVASVVYVAHIGQAKADAGSGYELSAITAVVLGGTSIAGGRGSIVGTLLGLFTIAVLQNGVRLADGPAELAGVLTGGVLLASIAADRSGKQADSGAPPRANGSELDMRNSQLAVLCIVILVAAGLVAGSNWMLAKSFQGSHDRPTDTSKATPAATNRAADATPEPPRKPLTIAMMPKSKGNAYFIACRKGAEEAAKELGIDLIWDGPTETDPAKQSEVVDAWITRGVDVIAVSVENREALSGVLRKARSRGIKVVTWDADAEPDARDFFVNQATPQGIGYTLMDNAARVLNNSGQFAIVTASLTAANQNEWRKHIEARLKDKYPDIKLAGVQPCDDQQSKAFEVTTSILNSNPDVKLIMAICSPGVPGAAEAVKQLGRKDVKVIGLGLPNDNKRFVKEGITDGVVLWNTMDLGYLAVHAASAISRGELKPGQTQIKAGKLGTKDVVGDNVMLGTPFTFDKGNIDQFDF
ncbi:MAG: substrate-binding domain-containing protein [Phycisphaerales bacterium]|nr:substrate-binding domain-containing protein [Phycisphaerales bacterium]